MMDFLISTPFAAFAQQNNLAFIGPEILLAIVILLCIWHLSFSKSKLERQQTWIIATFGVTMVLIFLGTLWWMFQQVHPTSFSVLNGMFKGDTFSLLIRTLLATGTLLVLLFTNTFINKRAEVPGEFYVIMLTALLGGMMLSGASDLIMVFVALETLSISSYILAGYMRGNILSAEAGLKYLLYGGMATAVLLFGLSILYGLTGATGYADIVAVLHAQGAISPLILSIMVVMILAGVSFKLSAAPFHMWAPDTYEGAPTPVVAFLSVVSKTAGFAFAIRLFSLYFGTVPGWAGLLSVLSVTSMVLGNVVALSQRNIKRLLAYSTVAHGGYLLLGLVVMTPASLASLVYYLMTYMFMNLGAFAVITHFENLTGRTDIAAYAGLVRKRPGLVFMFSMMLLSLAGIPITAGFFGKFFLFQAIVNAGGQYLWLVVVALLTSTVSLYYYLNVMRLMIISEPSDAVEAMSGADTRTSAVSPVGLVMAICLVATLGLGVLAQNFLTLAQNSVAEMNRAASPFAAASPAQHLPDAISQAK
jgi:NAD(P)H-quinone oxidoreductase subunit 2